MLLKRHFERLLLSPADLKPSRDDFEVVGVFNPGAIVAGGEVILLVRVAERPREGRQGFTALPRWSPGDGLVIDWVSNDTIEPLDPRVVKRKADGLVRLTFISHLRVVRCGDGRSLKQLSDIHFLPDTSLEEFGVEDPRITAIDGRYYFTYVAVSRHGAATALASTTDFRRFDRHGIIFCPEMWVARSPDLIHWGRHECLHGGGAEWETGRVGAGTPPVRFDGGWLEIYHGNRQPTRAGEVGTYATGVLLLDSTNPATVLRRTAASIFEPTADFERHGFVQDVVFPTGIVESGDSYLIYYGAADSCTAVVEFSKSEIREALAE
jgi:beta-1,2-mannobiose phosphorylase / 1,2-beta-oligomannan phosphorylase